MGNRTSVENFQAASTTLLAPIQCPAGTYGDTRGLQTNACSGRCRAGYYCAPGSTSPTQNQCPAGHYCLEGTGDAFYTSPYSISPPTPCIAGSSSLAGSSTCFPCQSGYSSSAGGLCAPCGQNTYSVNLCGQTGGPTSESTTIVPISAPPGPSGTAPAGIQVWYDGNDPLVSSDPITQQNDGVDIPSWKDKSGNNFHAVPVAGTRHSVRKWKVQNGLNAVLFYNNSLFKATYTLSPNTFQTAFQVFVVSKGVQDEVNNTPISLGINSQYDPWSTSRYLSNHTANCQSPNNLFSKNINLFSVLVFQGSGSYYTEWFNGTMVPSKDFRDKSPSNFSAVTNTNDFYISGRADRATKWNGYIYEIAAYNVVLSDQDRETIEGYLAWKWGFNDSLPSTHPYKLVRPLITGLTNPPFKPTGVTAVNAAAGVVVSWVGGQNATKYIVSLSGTSNNYSETIDGSNITTATVRGVAVPQYYNVQVTAENSIGSTPSDSIVIKLMDLKVAMIAGKPGTGTSQAIDGVNGTAFIYLPTGVALDSCGTLYVTDRNHYIRKVYFQTGTALSGTTTTAASIVTRFAGSGVAALTNTTSTSKTSSFDRPRGLAIDSSNNIYVADTYNHCIRKITADGVVTTLAGSRSSGTTNGTGSAAKFHYPTGVAVNSNGDVYVADKDNNMIRKITAEGVVTTFAGSTTAESGSSDGQGTNARFNQPWGLTFDYLGNLYVADSGNHTIRRITSTGIVKTVAGVAGTSGFDNGVGSSARFNFPFSIAIDTNGFLYVSDLRNHVVRQIVLTNRSSTSSGGTSSSNEEIATVTTFAGTGVQGYENGAAVASNFNSPEGITIDPAGNLYVADSLNNTIRKITGSAGPMPPQPVTCLTTLCKPCCLGTQSIPGSTSCSPYPVIIINSSGSNVGLARGFYQNDENGVWRGSFVSSLPPSLTANSLTSVGGFDTCTLHLFPGWLAFGYINQNPISRMDLDRIPYTGSSRIRTNTYLLIIVRESEITYTGGSLSASIPSMIVPRVGLPDNVVVAFPNSVVAQAQGSAQGSA